MEVFLPTSDGFDVNAFAFGICNDMSDQFFADFTREITFMISSGEDEVDP